MENKSSEKVIAFDGVRKRYRNHEALKGITLDIFRGEFIGLLGPNGAGKTTLVEILEGLKQPDSGSVKVLGKSWAQDAQFLRQRLSGVLQETLFINKLRVEETVNLFGSFYGCPRRRTGEVLELVELSAKRRTFVEGLSGGERQRLALGVAILNEPEIMILDEPTTGLDPRIRHDTWNILRRLNQENGSTMMLTTHYMEEAEYLCDRICIMNQGEILTQGTMTQLLKKHCDGEVIECRATRPERLEAMRQHPQVLEYDFNEKDGKISMLIMDASSFISHLLAFAQNAGVEIAELIVRKKTLDDLFMSLAGRGFHE
ncbi:ABC transporter ATP-binding protein [Salmonella enterica]|jgi:ABC-2 type transport system ATP-binding protein|uniref:ABC transporter ATP-binding protein n=1 Tax=Serratia TaxID=613 RepID=UPI000456206F|nr:ABC transporter ATP-binding protein [Serratia plymuthica]EJP5180666.1 ABC transporter ATP-binding protein [Salmonella enterica]AHY09200.1 ABC transporter ATP-binding protein [Serratia plymuthica]MBL3525607.1 ABC transporter ATP-binding protein [Serratia plymuthica]MEB6540892.1 ABC transporter ATP-binding protein [Serratia plymuthica]QPS56696.1 ABC transporter ATP-binding protein [Serratia plymuthica]